MFYTSFPFPASAARSSDAPRRRGGAAVRRSERALLLRPAADLQGYLEEGGIACFHGVQRPEPSLVREAPSFLRASLALARVFRDFDLIHCAEFQPPTMWPLPDVSQEGRCYATSATGRSGSAGGSASSSVLRATSPLSLATRSITSQWAAALPNYSPLRRDRHPTSGCAGGTAAAAHAVRSEFGLPKDAVVAAMFARVNPQKDYPTLIRAAALLREAHPALRFLIVGDNARVETNRRHFAEVQDLARRTGVLDRFVFRAFVPTWHD